MRTYTKVKLEDAIECAGQYNEQMIIMDDYRLSKHLDLFSMQMEGGYKENSKAACELPNDFETQVIRAWFEKD